MAISATCPQCGKRYNLNESLAGKKAQCKECRTLFRIPGEHTAAAATTAAASNPEPALATVTTTATPIPTAATTAKASSAPAPPTPPPPRSTPPTPPTSPARSQELSAGGIPIIRHPSEQQQQRRSAGTGVAPSIGKPPAAPAPPKAPPATPYMEQIVRHIEQHMGASPVVFKEKISEGIKLDLLIVPPTKLPPSEEHPLGTNHFTIITAGLSAKPQAVPAEALEDISPLQELMIALPGDWPGMKPDGTFDQNVIADEKHWWPFAFLKMVARMPAEYETFLAPGVTIPNGEEAEPFADNTKLGCMMAFMPMLSPNVAQLQIDDKTRIDFYALWPLYPEEMQLKLDKGLEPLLQKLMDAEVSELIVPDRANLCKKRRWFGK
jgi:hypothetical protein